MSKRILLAALFGGLIMFAWGFVSHTLLPLGKAGISKAPNEALITASLELVPHGLYWVPYPPDMNDTVAHDEWQKRWDRGPSAIVIKQPQGERSMYMLMAIEFGSNVVCAWLLALVLSACGGGYVVRASMGALIGLYASFAIDVSQWNWYAFPKDFMLASMIDQTIGAVAAAVVVATIVKPRE